MTKAEVREKFEGKHYPIHVIGRHIDITDAMKSYAVDKFSKIERFGERVIDATITMDIVKLDHIVDFIVDVNNTKIKVSARSPDMYASIDMAIAKLETKVRRYMTRLNDHHAKKLSEVDMNVHILSGPTLLEEVNDQIEEENLRRMEEELKPHKVVRKETCSLKTLSQQEAVMAMELSEDAFMVFRGEEDQKLKVIYRCKDGNYGIIEVER